MARFILYTAVVIAGTFGSIAHSNAQGCKLDGIRLDCGKGNDASILNALAANETTAVFENPNAAIDNFKKPSDLEVFRRSIDATWKRVNRAESAKRRQMLRRQISASEFEKWTKGYEAARTNYYAAMNFYRTLVWHGKTGKKPPAG